MATQVTYYVNTVPHTPGDGTTNGTGNGGTNSFTTLAGALTAIKTNYPTGGDLVAADVNVTILCSSGGGSVTDDGYASTGGITTDSTRFLTIKANTGDEAQMPWDANRYALGRNSGGSDHPLQFYTQKVVLQNIQIQIAVGLQALKIVNPGTAGEDTVEVSGCVFRNPSGTTTNAVGLYTYYRHYELKIYNNYFYDFAGTGGMGIDLTLDYTAVATDKQYIYNNTLVNCKIGIAGHATTGYAHLKNNAYDSLGLAGAAGYTGYFNASSTNNASDLTDAPGSNPQNSLDPTYANAGAKNYHLATNDAWYHKGADLDADANCPITVDFDGDARHATTPSVGADEGTGSTGNAGSQRGLERGLDRGLNRGLL